MVFSLISEASDLLHGKVRVQSRPNAVKSKLMLAPLICGKFNIHGISLEPCLQKSVLALLRVLQE